MIEGGINFGTHCTSCLNHNSIFFLFADNLPESLFNPFDIISYQIKFAPSLGPSETSKQAHNSPVPDSLFRETHCIICISLMKCKFMKYDFSTVYPSLLPSYNLLRDMISFNRAKYVTKRT